MLLGSGTLVLSGRLLRYASGGKAVGTRLRSGHGRVCAVNCERLN